MEKKLTININNDYDLKKFYSKLRIYKLFFNNYILDVNLNTKFFKNDTTQLLMCINAFNIKNKDKRLEYVYDSLCDFHDNLYINSNVCEFDKDGLCACQREYHHPASKNGCCGLCTYMGKNGCTIKSLACKSFFCRYITKKKSIPNYKKNKLYKYFLSGPQKEIASINYWNTKEENLRIMRKNSFIYNSFRKVKKMKRW